MAPTSTSINIKLTEPFVFLVGGTEHERARARRRRGLRTNTLGTNNNNTPTTSRPNSRSSSPSTYNNNNNISRTAAGLDEFILPGPSRARDRERRSDSPNPGGGSRSGSRARRMEGLTTGSGTVEEGEEADEPPPAMLRGLLILTLAKPSRIRDISIKLKGTSRTDWPEGIGPRRLDVLEETVLTSNSWTFFSASDTERRAVSIGPGITEQMNDLNLDDRGRTGSRRSASMMPTRDTSTGLSYSARDSAIHEDELEDISPQFRSTSIRPTIVTSPLSRISSSSNIIHTSPSSSPITPPFITDQWGPSPAYEVVASAPNSPAIGPSSLPYPPYPSQSHSNNIPPLPILGRTNSFDSFDLNKRTRTPSRSPLNPLNSSTGAGGRPSTGHSQLSQEDHYSPEREGDDSQERIVQTTTTIMNSRPTLLRMYSSGRESSLGGVDSSEGDLSGLGEERGRSRTTTRDLASTNTSNSTQITPAATPTESLYSITGSGSDTNNPTSSSSVPPSNLPSPILNSSTPLFLQQQQQLQQQSSSSNNASQSSLISTPPVPSPVTLSRIASPDLYLTTSNLGTQRKTSASTGPPASRSASSRPNGRFSLAGLTDKLRGKSTSRVRGESTSSRLGEEDDQMRGGRTESPDTRMGNRDQSRGRKTALKVLRDALTSPMEIGEENESGDEFDYDGEGDEHSNNHLHHNGNNNNNKGKNLKSKVWKEFKAGTYTYPISIPIPASLPPSINADFGHVSYTLKATVHRAGALTTNLTTNTEIVLVSSPGLDDTEENESIVVERFWETQMRYHIALSGKSFLVGGTIPISIRLHPLAKIKLYRITITLEQKTNYFASERKLTRHETPKKFPLLRIENKDSKEALLPIFTDGANAIHDHPLSNFFINPTSSDDTTPSLLDPVGPWFLEGHLDLPKCATRCNFSTNHEKANITVSHMLKIVLRVERGDDDFMDSKGKRKLWDVIIETPVHILSCRCSKNTLPAYSSTPPGITGTSSGSISSTPNPFSIPDCGYNHSASAPILIPQQHANLIRTVKPSTPQSTTSNNTSINPNTALEQSLLFARLVAGEETPNGEVPPTYDTAIHSSPTIGTDSIGVALERSRSSSSSITDSIMNNSSSRNGRSSSAVSNGSSGGGGGGGRGRSTSTHIGIRSSSSHHQTGRSSSTSHNGRSLSVSTSGGRGTSITPTEDREGRSSVPTGTVVRAGRSGSIVTMRGVPLDH